MRQSGGVVLVHYRKNKSGADETLMEVQKYSQGAVFQADLSEKSQVQRLFSEIKNHTGKLDALVNCAGEYRMAPPDDDETWSFEFQNIFFNAVYTTNEFLKLQGSENMRKIVNISSVYSIPEMSDADAPQYSAAKAAMNNFTCALAKKLAPNVLVNAIAPAYTTAPSWNGVPEEHLKKLAERLRIKRFIAAEEIGKFAVAVLENDAITGEIFKVDGGLHLVNC